ncbi:MAG: ABC transporter ATP-binding protein/permease [Lachnospiraceae bacterium]|nr:ABC transporter ATP-binding protein/permease [Lachnospiraceae bacterium]
MEVFKFGFRYWKRNLAPAILAIVMSLLALTADLILPMITAVFINHIIQSEPAEEDEFFAFLLDGSFGEIHSLELFQTFAVLFIVLLVVKFGLTYAKGLLNQKLGLNLETDLRMATYHKLMELDGETVSDYNTGELLTIINQDSIMFKELFCRVIPGIIDSIFVLVVAVVLLAQMNPWLLLIPLVLAPFFAAALLRFRTLARRNFQAIRAAGSTMSLAVQENIEAVRLVRSFTNEEEEKRKFDRANVRMQEAYVKQVKLSADFNAVFSVIKQIAYVGSIGVSAVLVMQGKMLIGYLVASVDYVTRIMTYITTINNSLFQMQQQTVSGRKVMDFMNCETRIPDGEDELQAVTARKPKIEDAFHSKTSRNLEAEDVDVCRTEVPQVPDENDELQIETAQNADESIDYQTGLSQDTKSADTESAARPHIRFDHMDMVLDGVPVLSDICLDIPYGKKVGIVGGTGSGKSTLLESLIRLHDATAGAITVNGRDIRSLKLESLRSEFSFVFQDVFLFSNTIDSNIAYARPEAEEDEVVTAAKHAQAHGFITKLPDDYQTIVGERGIGISGGQKQRVSIARALLEDAPVLVFDDSTSALDVDTERRLLKDIRESYPEKTVLITAHRFSSVTDCDEILYMQDGRIIERGTFAELMALGGHFARVYRIQEVQEAAVDYDALAEG